MNQWTLRTGEGPDLWVNKKLSSLMIVQLCGAEITHLQPDQKDKSYSQQEAKSPEQH